MSDKITITTTFGIQVDLDDWAEAYGTQGDRQAVIQDVLNYYGDGGLTDEVDRLVTRPENGSKVLAQTTQLGAIPETIKVTYALSEDGTVKAGELELPSWCSGDPASAVALYLFGYAGAVRDLHITAKIED